MYRSVQMRRECLEGTDRVSLQMLKQARVKIEHLSALIIAKDLHICALEEQIRRMSDSLALSWDAKYLEVVEDNRKLAFACAQRAEELASCKQITATQEIKINSLTLQLRKVQLQNQAKPYKVIQNHYSSASSLLREQNCGKLYSTNINRLRKEASRKKNTTVRNPQQKERQCNECLKKKYKCPRKIRQKVNQYKENKCNSPTASYQQNCDPL